MDPITLYGKLCATQIASGSEVSSKEVLVLYLTAAVIDQFGLGKISEEEVKAEIKDVLENNSIPNPTNIKSIRDTFSVRIDEYQNFNNTFDERSNFFDVDYSFCPVGGLTVQVMASHGVPLIKYITDQGHSLTVKSIPPAINSNILAGQIALQEANRDLQAKEQLIKIYQDLFPNLSTSLFLGDQESIQKLSVVVGRRLGIRIDELMSTDQTLTHRAIETLETVIYKRLDDLAEASRGVLTIIQKEKSTQKQWLRLEHAREQEKIIQQDINSSIQVADFFARIIFEDKLALKRFVGCMRAASRIFQLLSNFTTRSLGPTGFAAGLAGVLKMLVDLFNGPDVMIDRLSRIDQQLDRVENILRDGFEHLDNALYNVLQTSHEVLNQMIIGQKATAGQLMYIYNKIDFAVSNQQTIARNNIESQFQDLVVTMNDRRVAGKSLTPIVNQALKIINQHLRTESIKTSISGKQSVFPLAEKLMNLLEAEKDVRHLLGNLPAVLQSIDPRLSIEFEIPDIKHWAHVARTFFELIVLCPDDEKQATYELLQYLWEEGNKIKMAVVQSTSSKLLLALLDQYELHSIRDRSIDHIPITLDEVIQDLLKEPIIKKNLVEQLTQRMMAYKSDPFFRWAGTLQFLLSILTWRTSSARDQLTLNPRAAQIISSDKVIIDSVLNCFKKAIDSIDLSQIMKGQNLTEFLQEKILTDFRKHICSDIDRLRSNLKFISNSYRVREIDEVIEAAHALLKSRGYEAKPVVVPAF